MLMVYKDMEYFFICLFGLRHKVMLYFLYVCLV